MGKQEPTDAVADKKIDTPTEGNAPVDSLAEIREKRQDSTRQRRSPRTRQEPVDPSPPRADDMGQVASEIPPKKKRRRSRKRSISAATASATTPWTRDQFQIPPEEGKTRFHDLAIPDPIMHAIADLGFKYCTPIQAKTLLHANAGQNIAGKAQTGTGKTAAFLISIYSQFLEKPRTVEHAMGTPRALVLAPTRELVIQIAEDAELLSKYCPIHCLPIYGGMDLGKQKDKLKKQAVDMIVATPGRLLDFMSRGNIDLKHVEVLVIDEADRMLDMGFIPDVKRILRQTPAKNKRRTMLFSATLTDDVLRLAAQWMPDPVICEVNSDQVTVDTVEQIVYIITTHQKFRVLYHLLKKRPNERVLIFCNRREYTHRLAVKLRNYGIECSELSGAVPQKKRLQILDSFKGGREKVVVATDVAGRGLHVQDIGLVVNYEFPYDPEDYVHRIGRTARAGVAGTAISFACENESFIIPEIEKYIGADLPCRMPEEDLTGDLPHVVEKPAGARRSDQDGHSSRRPRSQDSRRGGPGRSSSRPRNRAR